MRVVAPSYLEREDTCSVLLPPQTDNNTPPSMQHLLAQHVGLIGFKKNLVEWRSVWFTTDESVLRTQVG